jgi:hypothetical protein
MDKRETLLTPPLRGCSELKGRDVYNAQPSINIEGEHRHGLVVRARVACGLREGCDRGSLSGRKKKEGCDYMASRESYVRLA